jgi:predicted ATPase
LRVASIEGEDFTAEAVARVLQSDKGKLIQSLSGELDRRHRLVRALALQRVGSRRLSRYRFRHDLFQKYLYDSQDEVERAYLHDEVGKVLEELYGEQASDISARLARHFEEAGRAGKAIHYLYRAGEKALQLSAYEEGIAHLTRGLALLHTLPDSPERAEQELALQLALGIAMVGLTSYAVPEVEAAFGRARDLCQRAGKTSQLCRALGELAKVYYVRAEHRKAHDLAQEALSLARQSEDPLLVALCHWYLGFISFSLGEYTTARVHLDQIVSFYDPHQHHHSFVLLGGSDAGPAALAYDACCLWSLGYPDQAVDRNQEALALARELDHPFTMADVLSYGGCIFSAMRRDAHALKDSAEKLMQLSDEKVPSWSCTGTAFHGEATVMLGQVAEGIAEIREGMAAMESIGARCYRSGTLRSLAEAQAQAGQPADALATLTEALALVEQTGERHWEAELYRLRAELMLAQGEDADAEASLQKALEVARRQEAKSWELRATVSLCRVWQKQGKHEEARQALAEVYNWFTEGFDTPDLKEAKALLDEVS